MTTMPGYVMTATNPSTVGFWEPCNATTLIGAKREATRRYKGGYVDDVIWVGYRDPSGQLQVLAVADNRNNKWVDAQ